MKKGVALLVAILLCVSISARANENNVKRIEFITYIMSGLGVINSNEDAGFIDLDKNDKYYNYIAAAKEHGIVTGYSDSTLKPYAEITRQEAIVVLSRAYKIKPVSGVYINGFEDYNKINEYAVGYVSAAVKNGIVYYENGIDFRPNESLTLQEMISLAEGFKKVKNSTMHFSFGYPKITNEKVYNAISIKIKMSRPCTVYYKLLPADKYLSGFKPRAEEITEFLTAVSIADVDMDVNIYPDDWKEYNLYVVGVDADGNYSDVESISNVTAHRFSEGDGTEKNPYRIYNKEQLIGIKYYPDKFYRLEDDIEIIERWQPIKIDVKGFIGFSGVLDGNYHKITGIEIKSNDRNVGLFSEIYGGTVKKLYIDAVVSGNENVGIIAGNSEGGTISECFVTGRVDALGNNAGGIVGSNNGKIENSMSAAYIVEASNYAGGIAGTNRGDILNCLSAAYSVTADMYASAVSGVNIGGKISYNVCANLYADDIITTRTGRVTTNKQYGKTYANYCYDKMMADTSVDFDIESHDGLEVSWDDLTSIRFYSDVMGWDTKNIWKNTFSEDFRVISLKGFESIDMIKGITVYAPVKIYNESDLLKVSEHPEYHYILMNDITINDNTKWKVIGTDESEESGFNGTFDGNNYSISGLHMKQDEDNSIYGMFGVISAGTVRNLKLVNVAIEGHSLVGGLAGINHGYIENCSINGKIYALRKSNMLSVGGMVGENYGIIENVNANMKIRASGQVLTAGGIVANNDGFIDSASFTGEIEAEQNTANSNAVAGGIAGISTSGFIYNSYADADIDSRASISYAGGISGIMNGGEIYKTSSDGQLYINSGKAHESTAYVGGVAGLTPEGLVMNSFSTSAIFIDSNKVYAGGVIGYNQLATIQNTYSINMIDSVCGIFDGSEGYTAGICGFSEEGFISESVALNTVIETNGYVDKVCNVQSEMVTCENNFARKDMEIYGDELFVDTATLVEMEEIKDKEFFFRPIIDGGRLGWSEGDVWYMDRNYMYPLLSGVKNQERFKMR